MNESEVGGVRVENKYLEVRSGSNRMELVKEMNVGEEKRTPEGRFEGLVEGSTRGYVGDGA
ncbi:hypothetical protein, partial [Paenibacillus xylanexedens]|uniref:hypothetical protein n=1 Tax=Paenibacillus xylanexedens TaxID=528191 RepID=UPI001C9315F2